MSFLRQAVFVIEFFPRVICSAIDWLPPRWCDAHVTKLLANFSLDPLVQTELNHAINISLTPSLSVMGRRTKIIGDQIRTLCEDSPRSSSHCGPFASNLQQVANVRCAQVNSASYPSRDGKWVVAYGLRGEGLYSVADWSSGMSACCTTDPTVR